MKITEQVAGFARPVVEGLGCKLWDVEYVREGDRRTFGDMEMEFLNPPADGS